MCLPLSIGQASRAPGLTTLPAALNRPSPTPHRLHLPNFHWCGPPFAFLHAPDADSPALLALALLVLACRCVA